MPCSDILHQDRRAFGRGLVGNTATHDAGAEHGSQLHVFSDFIVFGFSSVPDHSGTGRSVWQQTFYAG